MTDEPVYDPRAYPPVAVTVDLVLLTVREGRLHVLLVRRAEQPYRDCWALPGGFVRTAETLDRAAARELAEETGLTLGTAEMGASIASGALGHGGHLEQLRTYGDPGRDPRMRVVSVAYLALLPDLPAPQPGGDAGESEWVALRGPEAGTPRRLAFDHESILADGVERARAKLEYTTLATAFCPAEFTVADLRRVYEIVWGTPLDPRNFHRKATGSADFLQSLDRSTAGGAGRPAQLYRAGPASQLSPPLMRPPR